MKINNKNLNELTCGEKIRTVESDNGDTLIFQTDESRQPTILSVREDAITIEFPITKEMK